PWLDVGFPQSSREGRLPVEDALIEAWSLTGGPQLRAMHDAVCERAAVDARRALDRPGDRDELDREPLPRRPNGRGAVPPPVEEREVRRQIGVRQAKRALAVTTRLVLQARAHAVAQKHVDGGLGLRSRRAIGEVERSERVRLGEPMLERLDEARRRDRTGDER